MTPLEDKLANVISDLISAIYSNNTEMKTDLMQAMVRAHSALKQYNLQTRNKGILSLVEKAK